MRNQDAISKLKHIHEQELNRLIRDNDRLQRIIVRHGGAELFRTVGNNNNFDPLSTSRDDLSESSFHTSNHANSANIAHSPGMQFAVRGSSSANKQPLSKSPIYSSRIRESLTPPGKFNKDRVESPPRRSYTTAASGAKSHQQELQDQLASAKRSVGFDNSRSEGRSGSASKTQRVPDSPPPPPKSVKSVLNWGALHDSLNQQVISGYFL